MAILSFGNTFRNANQAITFKNTGTTLIDMPLFGGTLAGGAQHSYHLNYVDGMMRVPRHVQVNTVDSKGKAYKDDVAVLCALIAAGTLLPYSTTYNSTTFAYTVGASASFTSLADGSISFA